LDNEIPARTYTAECVETTIKKEVTQQKEQAVDVRNQADMMQN
jgi:hypothetical protein